MNTETIYIYIYERNEQNWKNQETKTTSIKDCLYVKPNFDIKLKQSNNINKSNKQKTEKSLKRRKSPKERRRKPWLWEIPIEGNGKNEGT